MISCLARKMSVRRYVTGLMQDLETFCIRTTGKA